MKTLITTLIISLSTQMTLAQNLTQKSESLWGMKPGLEYYGAQNQEATFDLMTDILIVTTKKEVDVKDVQKEMPGLYKFILGQMRRTPGNPAASYPKYSVVVLQSAPENEGVVRATIKISGKGVFRKDQESYNFYVPLDQSKLWTQAKSPSLML